MKEEKEEEEEEEEEVWLKAEHCTAVQYVWCCTHKGECASISCTMICGVLSSIFPPKSSFG